MYNFPDAPTNGMSTTTPDGAVYVFDGTKWAASSAAANPVPLTIPLGGTNAIDAPTALTNLGGLSQATADTLYLPLTTDLLTQAEADALFLTPAEGNAAYLAITTDLFTQAEADALFLTQAEADAAYVNIAGDAMTGKLDVPLGITTYDLSLSAQPPTHPTNPGDSGGVIFHSSNGVTNWASIQYATADGRMFYQSPYEFVMNLDAPNQRFQFRGPVVSGGSEGVSITSIDDTYLVTKPLEYLASSHDFYGPVGVDNINVRYNLDVKHNLTMGQATGVGDTIIFMGSGRTADGGVHLGMFSDTSALAGFEIYREAGVNGKTDFLHQGTGTFSMYSSRGDLRLMPNGEFSGSTLGKVEVFGNLVVSSSGQLGIGVTPLEPLHVRIGLDQNFKVIDAINVGATGGTGISSTNDADTAAGPLSFFGTSYFFVGSGYVGMSAASPASRLVVSGVGQGTPLLNPIGSLDNVLMLDDASGAGGAGGILLFSCAAQAIRLASIQAYNVNGVQGDITFSTLRNSTDATLSETMRITGIGGATQNISGAWAVLSAREMKQDIEPYTRGLDAIVALNPIRFRYRAGSPLGGVEEPSRPLLGLLADEVRPHVPEIVGSATTIINKAEVEIDTLEPGNLMFALINSIKELNTRLAALEGAGGVAREAAPPASPRSPAQPARAAPPTRRQAPQRGAGRGK